jgi:hypothetical protein
MGRYVEIKKVKADNHIYYYSVHSPDFQHISRFYIAINSHDKSISFYQNAPGQEPNFSVGEGGDTSHVHEDWIPSFLLYATLKKARQALASHSFDEYISFQS